MKRNVKKEERRYYPQAFSEYQCRFAVDSEREAG